MASELVPPDRFVVAVGEWIGDEHPSVYAPPEVTHGHLTAGAPDLARIREIAPEGDQPLDHLAGRWPLPKRVWGHAVEPTRPLLGQPSGAELARAWAH